MNRFHILRVFGLGAGFLFLIHPLAGQEPARPAVNELYVNIMFALPKDTMLGPGSLADWNFFVTPPGGTEEAKPARQLDSKMKWNSVTRSFVINQYFKSFTLQGGSKVRLVIVLPVLLNGKKVGLAEVASKTATVPPDAVGSFYLEDDRPKVQTIDLAAALKVQPPLQVAQRTAELLFFTYEAPSDWKPVVPKEGIELKVSATKGGASIQGADSLSIKVKPLFSAATDKTQWVLYGTAPEIPKDATALKFEGTMPLGRFKARREASLSGDLRLERGGIGSVVGLKGRLSKEEKD
jgi:hypothetical protein